MVIDENSQTPIYMRLSEGNYVEHYNDTFSNMFYIEEEKRDFINCYFTTKKRKILEGIILYAPYIESEKTLIINIHLFSKALLYYKYLGKNGLFLWIIVATIVSNIQTVKTVELFGLETSLGTILYGSTFLATDILNYKWFKRK